MVRVKRLIDPRQLPNKKFSYEKAYKYAKLMEQGVIFPSVNVFSNPNKSGMLDYNDGVHRVAAAKLTGMKLRITRSIKEK